MAEKIHTIIIEDRKKLTLSGVNDVERFDENTAVIYPSAGSLMIKGRALNVSGLDTDTGEMTVSGEISAIAYGNREKREKTGFFSSLFR